MANVLITGASSGIGYQLATLYANKGYHVYACGRNRARLEQLQTAHANITPLVFDICEQDAVLEIADKLPALNYLILNAGTCEYIDNPKAFDSSLFQRVMHTNVIATGYCLEAFLPKLAEYGQLGLMSSSAAYLPLTRSEAYGASKAAITYLAKTLSVDLAPHNIGVSAIHPGFIKTPLTDKNDFPMPMQISAEKAAEAIFTGMKNKNYDIHFPKRFTLCLKLFSGLPFALWRKLAIRMIK